MSNSPTPRQGDDSSGEHHFVPPRVGYLTVAATPAIRSRRIAAAGCDADDETVYREEPTWDDARVGDEAVVTGGKHVGSTAEIVKLNQVKHTVRLKDGPTVPIDKKHLWSNRRSLDLDSDVASGSDGGSWEVPVSPHSIFGPSVAGKESVGDDDDNDDSESDGKKKEGDEFEGDRVARLVGGRMYFGTVVQYGYRRYGRKRKIIPAWCVHFDERIVEYYDGTKGHAEDLVEKQLEEALALFRAAGGEPQK
jgi:hypothetical protein